MAEVWSIRRRTAGRNPMSDMRSASSSTTVVTSSRRTSPRSMRSSRRPGHATTTLTPLCRARHWSRYPVPPKMETTRWLSRPRREASTACTCEASSRVGTSTSARGTSWSRLRHGGHDRHAEGQRLARTRGRLAADVLAGQCGGNGGGLNGKRARDAQLLQPRVDVRGHAEINEGRDGETPVE